jgi:hypothetical protein
LETQHEIPEAQAEGKIKEIYEDIKTTLRIPAVGSIFRVLALQPDYLQMAWRVLKPNVQTIYFEERSDELRKLAVDAAYALKNRPLPSDPDAVRPVVSVPHYALAKLFLATSSLRVASTGQQPKLLKLPEAEKRQIMPGVPSEAATSVAERQTEDQGDANQVFDDMMATLHLPSLGHAMLALGRWPDFIASGWEAWKSSMQGLEYRRYRQLLYRTSEDAINSLPFRMDVYPHALRHAGLSETDIDTVRRALDSYHRAIPDLMGAVSLLALATGGREWARSNPFPPKLLA